MRVNLFSFDEIKQELGKSAYRDSFTVHEDAALWLEKSAGGKMLSVVARPGCPTLTGLHGEEQSFKKGLVLKQCPCTHANGRALREALPWLKPALLGLKTSAGMGDRLGLATPGHARAVLDLPSNSIAPIFAQQSIREMERSGRSPDDVMNDAAWGVFQSGLRCMVGADADHLKTPDDIDLCAAAGFTFFTIDPGAHVDNDADKAEPAAIEKKLAALPWNELECTREDLHRRYARKKFDFEPDATLERHSITIAPEDISRAAVKYGRAVAHVVVMARHLESRGIAHELEISVDETETPTSLAEHIYVASELKRLGVKWVSLAPRYVGRFEKGVDYIGDLENVARHLAGHAAIARGLGPYKLSLHSGSDKFSIYPLMSRACGGLVHLKTAGTSYVEALRVIAEVDPAYFRELCRFAVERYPADKASYHVSAVLAALPDFEGAPDGLLPGLLDDHHLRQALHVTFGSVLKESGARLKSALLEHEEKYYETLRRHFRRHLEPFAVG